jgi:hypothetical protein
MAPFLTSCEGRGTSRRTPPVTGRRPEGSEGEGSTSCVSGVAAFRVDDEIEAAGAMRDRGTVADAVAVSVGCGEEVWEACL